jgi:hypothetical protein
LRLFFGNEELKKKLKRKFRISPDFYGLMPDFTARAIGIAPKTVSIKQAMKEIMKLQSGFEIRSGARVKGISMNIKGINEKNLMRGIIG